MGNWHTIWHIWHIPFIPKFDIVSDNYLAFILSSIIGSENNMATHRNAVYRARSKTA